MALALAKPADSNEGPALAPMAGEIRDSRILVVDDSPITRQLLHGILEKAGFRIFAFAADGFDALEQVVQFAPDLIILDVQMPKMDGFEVCRILREDRDTADIPILFQTGNTEADIRAQAFDVGANDVVAKPLQARELVARARIQLENRMLVRNLSAHFQRLENELDAAFKMQSFLLPSHDNIEQIKQFYGIDIECFADASSELGGDVWGIWPADHNKLAFYMADFSGHGVVAALNVFRLHTLIQEHARSIAEPHRFLGHLNGLLSKVLPTGQYATMIAGYIDQSEGKLYYAAAAAPRAIVARDSGRSKPFFLDTAGVPLGITERAVYETHELPFGPGDFLLLYSDALIESPGERSRALEEEGLMSLVECCAIEGPMERLVEQCLAEFFDVTKTPLGDDLTVVGLSCPPRGERRGADIEMLGEAAEWGTPGDLAAAGDILLAIGDSAFRELLETLQPIRPGLELRHLALEEASADAIAVAGSPPHSLLIQAGPDTLALERLLGGLAVHESLAGVPFILLAESAGEGGSEGPPPGRNLHGEAACVLDGSDLGNTLRRALDRTLESGRLYLRLLDHAGKGGAAPLPALSGSLEFKTIEQAHRLATLVSQLCPDPSCAVIGLTELMINAIEHGNLEITFSEKTELLRGGTWSEEVERRLLQPRFRDRFAVLSLDSGDARLRVAIKDQGKGFDATPYLTFDPRRMAAPHGRGIALANSLGFDSLTYRAGGTEVDITIALEEASTGQETS